MLVIQKCVEQHRIVVRNTVDGWGTNWNSTLGTFYSSSKGKIKKKKVCLIWLATTWIIWNARNKLYFKNETCVLADMVADIKVVS